MRETAAKALLILALILESRLTDYNTILGKVEYEFVRGPDRFLHQLFIRGHDPRRRSRAASAR